MIPVLSAILLLQQAPTPVADSMRRARRRALHDVPVTPEMMASAYKDSASRDLIARARHERTVQDTSLRSYDAVSKERITANASLRATGPEKMILRSETASRVRWQRGRGAIVDVLGAR